MTPLLKPNEPSVSGPVPFAAEMTKSDSLVAHDRLSELAAILATGIHRLRAIHSASPECIQTPADSSQTGLDQAREFALMEPGLQPESEEFHDVH